MPFSLLSLLVHSKNQQIIFFFNYLCSHCLQVGQSINATLLSFDERCYRPHFLNKLTAEQEIVNELLLY